MPLRHRGQGIAPLILNLPTVWSSVDNFMSLPLQPWKRTLVVITRRMGKFKASLDVLDTKKISSLPGFKPQVNQPVA